MYVRAHNECILSVCFSPPPPPSVQLVVSGLFSTIKSMGSIFFMTILVLAVFSVSGVLFFRVSRLCTYVNKPLYKGSSYSM